jgi:hypothetical protein
MTVLQQRFGRVEPDEARSAGKEYPHGSEGLGPEFAGFKRQRFTDSRIARASTD